MRRAIVLTLLLTCLVSMGVALLCLMLGEGSVALWFAVCISTGVAGLAIDDTPT